MSELGEFLGQRERDREEDKQNLTDIGETLAVPIFPIEVYQLVDWNLKIIRSDTGEWARRRWQWITTEDFNTWTLDEGLITEHNEIKLK